VKKLIIPAMILVVLGCAIMSYAGPLVQTVTVATATNYGGGIAGSLDSISNGKLFGQPFGIGPVTARTGYLLSIYFRDTVAAAADASDSVMFILCRKPNGAVDSCGSPAATAPPSGWQKVYQFDPKMAWATNFPISKYIPPESLVAYPLGPGIYQWLITGGRGQVSHYFGKAYKFDAFIEYEKAY
jgi:hypothetical protein